MKRKIRKHCFTLLEVMVSMGVFAILMLALMQFFNAAQGVWSRSTTKMDTFAEVRTAMDMMALDFASAYYEYNHSNKLAFFCLKNSTEVALVTVRQMLPKSNATTRLTEVRYRYDSEKLELQVQNISDKDVETNDKQWPTKEQSEAISEPGNVVWVSDMDDKELTSEDMALQTLVSNVVGFEIKCYSLANGELNSIPSGGTTLPYRVHIKLAVVNNETIAKLMTLVSGENADKKRTAIADLYSTPDTSTAYELLKQGLMEFSRDVIIERMQYQ